MGSANENVAVPSAQPQAVTNPWDVSRIPGGSSGGSAAAVAACLTPAATGTDTGGSIRQPAALCNLTGIKPTYGRVSRYGMIAYASSLDQAGPIAKSAEDCALLLNPMSFHDPRDSTSLADSGEDFTRHLQENWNQGADSSKPLAGLRIGLPKEFFAEGLASSVADAIHAAKKVLHDLGASISEVSLPKTKLSIPVYYVLAPAEASSNLSRFDGVRYGHRAKDYRDLTEMYKKSRTEGFGAEVKKRILIGSYVLSHGYYDAYYLKAQKIRRIIANDFQTAFQSCDLILGPVAPDIAWRFGEKSQNPIQMYLADIYTLSANLAGLPAMSAPCGFSPEGMPIGMQLIGNYFSEARMLQVAHRFQQATDWHRRQANDSIQAGVAS
jgi:aspartyl-tRNA(Asn)/glutamyl-tRNA(Gln) amidotransferase subunit A